MVKNKKSLWSLGLLVILLMGIFPVESFHEHHSLTVCKETSKHIEEKSVECELCDFVLPVFDLQSEEGVEYLTQFRPLFIAKNYDSKKKNSISIPLDRGPPVIA